VQGLPLITASLETLAVGDIENYLPNNGEVLITSGLPADLDGVLDPTEAVAPLGYTIDIPGASLLPLILAPMRCK
jgi:hypothetical protein